MFIACLFTITKTWEPKCPSLFVGHVTSDHTTETDPRGLMLSERSQSRKTAYRSRVIFHSGILKATKLQWWADQWLPGAQEGRESTTLKIQQGSIWGNGVCCVLTVAGATQIYARVKIHRSVHRAKVNFAICYLKDKFWTTEKSNI